jgi:hypothetical protein
LEKNPRKWAKKLHVPPSVYAWAGGWTFGGSGERIELNYDACFHVAPASGDTPADVAVSVAAPREDTCSHCGSRLIDILTLDGRDARLAFLGIGGVLRIPVCPMCATMCERTIVRYTLDGDGAPELVEPFRDGDAGLDDEEYKEMTSGKFMLAERPESLFFARGCDDSAVTVGGFAGWIQDFRYDACPDCGKTMRYLASVPWTALSDYCEGTLFLEICPDCRIVSAFHQQT